MAQKNWEIEFYSRSNDRCPVTEFLNSLPKNDLPYIIKYFDRLEEYGAALGRPYVAPLKDGIWELRPRVGKVRYRFFYFFGDGRKFVVTHGIKKKKRKIDNSDIEKAIRYRNDYFDRHGKG